MKTKKPKQQAGHFYPCTPEGFEAILRREHPRKTKPLISDDICEVGELPLFQVLIGTLPRAVAEVPGKGKITLMQTSIVEVEANSPVEAIQKTFVDVVSILDQAISKQKKRGQHIRGLDQGPLKHSHIATIRSKLVALPDRLKEEWKAFGAL